MPFPTTGNGQVTVPKGIPSREGIAELRAALVSVKLNPNQAAVSACFDQVLDAYPSLLAAADLCHDLAVSLASFLDERPQTTLYVRIPAAKLTLARYRAAVEGSAAPKEAPDARA